MAVTLNSSRRPAAAQPRRSVLNLLRENVIWLAAAAAMICTAAFAVALGVERRL